MSGKRVGILGGGQLGAMLAESLQALGARVRVFDPDPAAPAGARVADRVVGDWRDRAALTRFADGCDVLTCDTEHVPLASLRDQPWATRLRPSLRAIAVAQHRVREKAFLACAGLPHASWRAARGAEEVRWAAEAFGFPLIVKRAEGGYDGRGQAFVRDAEALASFLDAQPDADALFVLEEPVRLLAELSCVVARSASGAAVTFPLLENAHRDHILDATVLPARLAPAVAGRARSMAVEAARALDVHGLLTVEFFLGLRRGGGAPELLVNEIAPRPHNSGHVTRRACTLSQFDALARLLLDLPVPAPDLLGGAYAMANLLGDLWSDNGGRAPDFSAAAALPEVLELHVYGKQGGGRTRKMGHLIARGQTPVAALAAARHARELIREGC